MAIDNLFVYLTLLGEFPVNHVIAWEYTTSRFCEDGWFRATFCTVQVSIGNVKLPSCKCLLTVKLIFQVVNPTVSYGVKL